MPQPNDFTPPKLPPVVLPTCKKCGATMDLTRLVLEPGAKQQVFKCSVCDVVEKVVKPI
jgi:hypothetical protein